MIKIPNVIFEYYEKNSEIELALFKLKEQLEILINKFSCYIIDAKDRQELQIKIFLDLLSKIGRLKLIPLKEITMKYWPLKEFNLSSSVSNSTMLFEHIKLVELKNKNSEIEEVIPLWALWIFELADTYHNEYTNPKLNLKMPLIHQILYQYFNLKENQNLIENVSENNFKSYGLEEIKNVMNLIISCSIKPGGKGNEFFQKLKSNPDHIYLSHLASSLNYIHILIPHRYSLLTEISKIVGQPNYFQENIHIQNLENFYAKTNFYFSYLELIVRSYFIIIQRLIQSVITYFINQIEKDNNLFNDLNNRIIERNCQDLGKAILNSLEKE